MPDRNMLLASLSARQIKELANELEHIELATKQVLHGSGEPIPCVYFPVDGVVSMVNEPIPGEVVEVATIGREGVVGLPLVLGAESMPSRAFVQVPGEAFRLRAEAFRNLVKRNLAFQALLMRYTLALVNQIAQSASCNRLHEVHERCARWLLQTHDRVTSDSFPLTQEFLGQMLGARRPTVSVAAGMLQKRGLIQYSRGVISILDRKGLERASCPCYGFITREYQRLMKF